MFTLQKKKITSCFIYLQKSDIKNIYIISFHLLNTNTEVIPPFLQKTISNNSIAQIFI